MLSTDTRIKYWQYAALAIFIITALFSSGYHHFDEHYQILEFAHYKTGASDASALAWEYHAKMRPGIQPLIAYSFIQTFKTLGIYTPFLVATVLRLLMAVFSWFTINRLLSVLLKDFETQKYHLYLIWCGLFLWYIPYISVRFSAEAFSAAFMYWGLSYLLSTNKTYLKILLAGLLLGIAWYARVQLGLAFIGLAAWLIINKWHIKYWLLFLSGTAISIAINLLPDYWLYSDWTFTPYNYFAENILDDKSGNFGVSPWWKYFEFFIMEAVPPISIFLFVFFIRGISFKPLHLFSLMCFTFIVSHFFIGHKEMRFLFPMSIPFSYLAAVGFTNWIDKVRSNKLLNFFFKLSIGVNILLLTYAGLHAPKDTIQYYKFMYQQAEQQPVTLVSIHESPYNQVTLESNYYKHPNLTTIVIEDITQLPSTIDSINNKEIYLFSPRKIEEEAAKQHHLTWVYSAFPDWLLKFNFNNWQERSKIGMIYRVDDID